MKVVTRATVRVVSPAQLKVGDEILWTNWKRKVVDIDLINRKIKLTDPYGDLIEELPFYLKYYVIESCEEQEFQL